MTINNIAAFHTWIIPQGTGVTSKLKETKTLSTVFLQHQCVLFTILTISFLKSCVVVSNQNCFKTLFITPGILLYGQLILVKIPQRQVS